MRNDTTEWAAEVGGVGRVAVVAGPVGEGDIREAVEVDIREAAEVEAVAVEANGIPKRRMPMARKFWNGSPEKPAGASLKSLRKSPSARSTTALSRNCVSSTTWVLPPIKTAHRPVIITSNCR